MSPLFRRPANQSSVKPRPPERPQPRPGDRVRFLREPGTMPAHEALCGATGLVTHVSGDRVVVQLDERYLASGLMQRTFYSYPRELEIVQRVGRMGAVDLYDEPDGDAG